MHLPEQIFQSLERMAPDRFKDALMLALGDLVQKEISADQLLGRMVDVVADLMDADRGTLYVLDAETDELVSVAAHLPEMPELRVPVTQGVAGFVGRTGRVLNVPRSEEDARFWKKIDETTGYHTRTMLAGPIRGSDGRIIGVVQLLNKRSGSFDEQDEELLDTLAHQAGALLERTTLGPRLSLVARPKRRPPRREEQLALGEKFNGVVAEGAAMTKLLRDLRRVAETDATVLLRGETGTGKSLVARTVHHNSRRADGPFVHLDCTTLPESLIESELFGHEKGAFTGATERRDGKVGAAEGGTLFLDEIGELSPALQAKLLVLLQERTFTPVGSTARRQADIRVVAATNRDLEEAMAEGSFREDLYYRLRVVELRVPPLRERGAEDLTHLIEHFVERAARRHGRSIARITDAALERLTQHRWPGNVRELENCLESAVIFADDEITVEQLSLPGGGGARGGLTDGEPTLRELEARYVAQVLARLEGNRTHAAEALGIGRNTLLRKIREYGLE